MDLQNAPIETIVNSLKINIGKALLHNTHMHETKNFTIMRENKYFDAWFTLLLKKNIYSIDNNITKCTIDEARDIKLDKELVDDIYRQLANINKKEFVKAFSSMFNVAMLSYTDNIKEIIIESLAYEIRFDEDYPFERGETFLHFRKKDPTIKTMIHDIIRAYMHVASGEKFDSPAQIKSIRKLYELSDEFLENIFFEIDELTREDFLSYPFRESK